MMFILNVLYFVCVIFCVWENKKLFDIDFVVIRASTTFFYVFGVNVNDSSCAYVVSNVKCIIVVVVCGIILIFFLWFIFMFLFDDICDFCIKEYFSFVSSSSSSFVTNGLFIIVNGVVLFLFVVNVVVFLNVFIFFCLFVFVCLCVLFLDI